jgi:predicted NodU family carbamoyl transferase
MIVVVDGSGDFASISFYVGENGTIRQIRTNGSVFDSLGMFYSVISSTQGGWTALSSEGRYMGAAAYGDMNRSTNLPWSRNLPVDENRECRSSALHCHMVPLASMEKPEAQRSDGSWTPARQRAERGG